VSIVGLSGPSFTSLLWEFLREGKESVVRVKEDPLLEEAAYMGYLVTEEATTFVCGERPTYLILKCPKCGKSSLETIGAWIHVGCGAVSYAYRTCPNCGEVGMDEMVEIGPVYRCLACNEIVNYPEIVSPCTTLKVSRIKIYRLTEEAHLLLNNVSHILANLPEPNVKFLEIGGVKVEALLIKEGTAILIGNEDRNYHRDRATKLECLGLSTDLISIRQEDGTPSLP